MSERTCPNCGERSEDAKFCPECGERLPVFGADEGDAPPRPDEADTVESSAGPPPPPPPVGETLPGEERDVAEAPDVAGAELSGSELPPSEPPDAPAPFDPDVTERASEEFEADEQEALTPETLEPRGPHHDPIVAGATPMQQAAEDARAPAPPVDGQLRCPNCHEAVYEGDRVCWACSRALEGPEEPAEPRRAPEGPPGGPPSSGAPVERSAYVRPAPEETSRPPEPSRPRPAGEPSDQVSAYAWWAFGLGLLSVFTCGALGLLGIVAVWLGISSARRDGGPIAIAGAIFGVIGLLMLLAWLIGFAIVMPEMTRPSPMHIMLPTFL